MLKGEYYGSIAELNLWGVPQISTNQYSSAAIWVINDGDGSGATDQINSILAGWMVSHILLQPGNRSSSSNTNNSKTKLHAFCV